MFTQVSFPFSMHSPGHLIDLDRALSRLADLRSRLFDRRLEVSTAEGQEQVGKAEDVFFVVVFQSFGLQTLDKSHPPYF